MATLTLRNLDDSLQTRLRTQAAVHGRTVEDEAVDIIRTALPPKSVVPGNLAEAIRARFAPVGGMELPEIVRDKMREPPVFEE